MGRGKGGRKREGGKWGRIRSFADGKVKVSREEIYKDAEVSAKTTTAMVCPKVS